MAPHNPNILSAFNIQFSFSEFSIFLYKISIIILEFCFCKILLILFIFFFVNSYNNSLYSFSFSSNLKDINEEAFILFIISSILNISKFSCLSIRYIISKIIS